VRCQRPSVWSEVHGEATGWIGTPGVAEEHRERGIGLAPAATVTEMLGERGPQRSFVGWTWLVEWYGALGYRVCRELAMSWREVG
jgi:hypothetical protein